MFNCIDFRIFFLNCKYNIDNTFLYFVLLNKRSQVFQEKLGFPKRKKKLELNSH